VFDATKTNSLLIRCEHNRALEVRHHSPMSQELVRVARKKSTSKAQILLLRIFVKLLPLSNTVVLCAVKMLLIC